MRAFECGNSLEVLLYLLKIHPQIQSVTLDTYIPAPLLKDRAPRVKEGIGISKLFDRGADMHSRPYKRSELNKEGLLAIAEKLKSGEALNLRSRVLFKPETSPRMFTRLLPIAGLVDCGASNITKNLVVHARSVFSNSCFGQPHGFILHSGNGLHFMGVRLLEEHEFQDFCGRLLLADDLADVRHIGHKLVDGELTVRIAKRTSAGELQIPQVLERW